MQTTNQKIDNWKSKGNGPWIVLRLQPSQTGIEAELRLAEIIFRPANGQINCTLVSKDFWKQYNGYRAIAIFLLLAAAKRTEALSPGKILPIATTSLRPSWLTAISELTQEKKFQNSVWLSNAFGIQTSKKIGCKMVNGLAKIAKVKGRTGKAIKNEEEIRRVLSDADAKKAELLLQTSNLKPNKITILVKDLLADPEEAGLTDPKELRRLAVVLESSESKWWNIIPELESAEVSNQLTPTTPPPQKPEGDALASSEHLIFPERTLRTFYRKDQVGVEVTSLRLPEVLNLEVEAFVAKSPLLPESVKVRVCEPSRISDGGLRLNLAIRWGLNRRPGIVILRGGNLDRVFCSFVEAENLFREATRIAERNELFSPRVWFRIEKLPARKADKGAWLATLAERHKISADEWGRLESETASLGVMFHADTAVASPQRMREFTASVTSLLNETKKLEPFIVIHTESASTATSLVEKLGSLIDSAACLPCEILEVVPEFVQTQSVPVGFSSWKSPSSLGQALLQFCRQLDPDENFLRLREFKALRAAVIRFVGTGLEFGDSNGESLPHAQDIVADLDRIKENQAEAIHLFFKLTKDNDVLRVVLPALIEAMAAMDPPMRAAALEAAVPDFDLVEAWLTGLAPESRLNIPDWWVNANPAHQESVLAALIRKAKRGDQEAKKIAKDWLPSLSPRLRETAQSVLDNASEAGKSFWHSGQRGKSLLFLGECDPALEIPIDRVSPLLLNRPEFWQLVQRLPLTIDLIRKLVDLPDEYRGVIGLCSEKQWAALKHGHLMPQVFNWRACHKPTNI
jgi:hypothetical protein